MLAEFFRSPVVAEMFLLLLLLAWLTVSAVMTIRSGHHGAEPIEQRRDATTRPVMPPAARAITGAPRS
jgi:hypothetical protein